MDNSVPNYGGMRIKEARKKIIEDLQAGGYVVKIEELEYEVQTHERCGKEGEYSVMNQWFIDTMSQDFIKIGNEIHWVVGILENYSQPLINKDIQSFFCIFEKIIENLKNDGHSNL